MPGRGGWKKKEKTVDEPDKGTREDEWTLFWAPTKWYGSVNRCPAEGSLYFPAAPEYQPQPQALRQRALQ
jgi:hypothetical protein